MIIAEATTSLKRLSVSEAVMELDLTGAACIVFQHGSSGRVNIIYRRADGNVGWVDPPVGYPLTYMPMPDSIDAPCGPPYGPPPLRDSGWELARGSWHRSCVGVEADKSGPGPKPASRLIFLTPNS